jgi:predicted ATP-grasp superfamily ATP-dependent carboligase
MTAAPSAPFLEPHMPRATARSSGAGLDAVILDSRERGSLAVARCLGRSGYRLAMGGYGSGDPGLYTRFARRRAVFTSPAADMDRYAAEIVDWLEVNRPDTVIASSDQTATALASRRDDVERVTAVALPPPGALEIALDKRLTLEAATRCGVPIPRTVTVATPQEVLAAGREMGYPCVLKPSTSWRMTGAPGGSRVVSALLPDERAALRHAGLLVDPLRPGLLQEYVTGRREAITIFRTHERLVAMFAMAASRTWPPLGGSSVMRESIELPQDIAGHADALATEIGYAGYGEVEFRRTDSGRPLLMEINPRFSASVELALRSGVDFAALQLEWARGGPLPAVSAYRAGVRLSWLGGELRLLGNRIVGSPEPRVPLRRLLSDVAGDYSHPPRIDGIDLRDPMPTLHTLFRSITGAAAAAGRRS